MVTDSTRDRRRDGDGDRADDRPERGQVILIGAIALAFIVLGVVVVFNGVLYTETLSSADTGQSASEIDATELEVRQGVACLAAADDDEDTDFQSLFADDELEAEIEEYADLYRNATANSQPAAVDITPESGSVTSDLFDEGVDVTVTYDTSEYSYERTLTVTADACPRSPSIEAFNVTSVDENQYDVEWAVRSSHSDLSKLNVTLLDESGEVIDNTTRNFGTENYHEGSDTLESDDDESATEVRIVVRNEADYIATETEDLS